MKKFVLLSPLTFTLFLSESFAQWQTPVATESFSSKRVINTSPLRQPFAMVMGPDDSLWVTERRGYVTRVNTSNGGKTQLLNIAGLVKFTTSGSGASRVSSWVGLVSFMVSDWVGGMDLERAATPRPCSLRSRPRLRPAGGEQCHPNCAPGRIGG